MMNQSNTELTQLRWTIRTAQESDVDDLIKMRLELQRLLEEKNPNIWRMSPECHERLNEQIIQNLDDKDTCILVAIDSNCKIIAMATGMISFHRYRIPSTIASIETVFVLEEWRGKGIGTSLVRELCQFFTTRCVKDVSVRYVVGNDDDTRFWQKLDFQPRIIIAGTNLHDLESKV